MGDNLSPFLFLFLYSLRFFLWSFFFGSFGFFGNLSDSFVELLSGLECHDVPGLYTPLQTLKRHSLNQKLYCKNSIAVSCRRLI